jgi:Cu(I)/Ag(I) efflux system membrane fusion protein
VDGWYQVLSGITEGEPVVTQANFLIDSESRLKAALSDMVAPKTASPGPPQH